MWVPQEPAPLSKAMNPPGGNEHNLKDAFLIGFIGMDGDNLTQQRKAEIETKERFGDTGKKVL